MAEQPLFDIDHLQSSYQAHTDHLILDISNTTIRRGITCILGSSGSGKSTLLESLALMTNTLGSESKIHFYSDKETNPIELSSLWEKPNKKKLNQVRKNHFKFIFQETQLIPHYNISENIYSSQIIQEKIIDLNQINHSLGALNLDGIDLKKSPKELSGGQKQRVAFIDSQIADFSVLFCDEPTGNLDSFNSKQLMNSLEQTIERNESSAIIVTHDIDLAIRYADQIYVLEPLNSSIENGTHTIKDEGTYLSTNNLEKKKWIGFESNESLKRSIESIVNINYKEDKNESRKSIDKYDYNQFSFLFRKELKSILTIKSISLACIMSFITIFGIGMAEYSKTELENQKTPIVKQVVIPLDLSGKTESLRKKFAKKEFLQKLNLKNITESKDVFLSLINDNSLNHFGVHGRTINLVKDSSVLNYLTNEYHSNQELIEDGIIISDRTFKRLKCNSEGECKDSTMVYGLKKSILGRDSKNEHFAIPIKGIVHRIPGNVDFLCTEKFAYNYQSRRNDFLKIDSTKLYLHYKDEIGTKGVDSLRNYLEKRTDLNFEELYHSSISNYSVSSMKTNKIELRFNSIIDDIQILKDIQSLEIFKDLKLFTEKDFNSVDDNYMKKVDYMLFNFQNFKKIKEFEKAIVGGSNIEYKLDSKVIKEKFAFQTIDDLSSTLINLIVIISSLSLLFIFSRILSTHIERIKRVLGNYMASGLESSYLVNLYLLVMVSFISLVITISYIMLAIVQFVYNRLDIFNPTMFYALLIIFGASLLATYWTARNSLNKAPGDLIYGR